MNKAKINFGSQCVRCKFFCHVVIIVNSTLRLNDPFVFTVNRIKQHYIVANQLNYTGLSKTLGVYKNKRKHREFKHNRV